MTFGVVLSEERMLVAKHTQLCFRNSVNFEFRSWNTHIDLLLLQWRVPLPLPTKSVSTPKIAVDWTFQEAKCMVMVVSLALTTFLCVSVDYFPSPQFSLSVQWSSVLKSQQLLNPCVTVLTSRGLVEEDRVWLELQQLAKIFHYWNAEQPLRPLSTPVKVRWSKLAISGEDVSWLKIATYTGVQCSYSRISSASARDLLAACPMYLCNWVCTGYLMDFKDSCPDPPWFIKCGDVKTCNAFMNSF